MDFQSVNPLNIRLNIISGNLLPITADDTSFSILLRIYSALMWLLQIVLLIALIPGCIYVPKEKLLTDGVISLVIIVEMFFMIVQLHVRKDLVGRLIRRMNDILRTADDTMQNIVTMTLQPVQAPLQFYWITGMISIMVWNCIPFVLLFEKDVFFYKDYRIPIAFSGQPFSTTTFLLGSFVLSICSVYTFLKKVGVDVYMMHMVLLVTAQYRYTAVKIATIFQNRNENIHSESRKTDSSKWKETEMKTLCRHHNALIQLRATTVGLKYVSKRLIRYKYNFFEILLLGYEFSRRYSITLLLKDLLSLNFSIIYMNSVLRFCFITIMLSTIPLTTFWEGISILMYASGSVVQLYILCSCVQQLLNASTEVTDEAFHQEWYLSESPIKNIFTLIIIANNLECKLATFENFNLSLPSFMTILNQSYSVALLFLKMK